MKDIIYKLLRENIGNPEGIDKAAEKIADTLESLGYMRYSQAMEILVDRLNNDIREDDKAYENDIEAVLGK